MTYFCYNSEKYEASFVILLMLLSKTIFLNMLKNFTKDVYRAVTLPC